MSNPTIILLEGTLLKAGISTEIIVPGIYDDLNQGDQVSLANEDGEMLATAFIDLAQTVTLKDLSDDDLSEIAHPAMRTRHGAFNELLIVDFLFTDDQPLTYLVLTVDNIQSGSVYVEGADDASLDYEQEFD